MINLSTVVLAQAEVPAESVSISGGETFAFWVLAIIAVGAATGMLVARKAVHSALFLATTMVALACLYLAQSAPFLGVVQIVVYTGAVMMLFLFVLMLVGVDASDSLVETIRGQRLAALVTGLAFGVLLVLALSKATVDQFVGLDGATEEAGGNVEAIAELLFGRYVFVFELTAALLITAAMGALVLTHRERVTGRPDQRSLSTQRFRTPGVRVTPKPTPGVFARHNAVDTPALLPDGSPLDESVPDPLRVAGTARTFSTADGRQVQARSLEVESSLQAGEGIVRTGTPVEPHRASAPRAGEGVPSGTPAATGTGSHADSDSDSHTDTDPARTDRDEDQGGQS